MKTTKKLTALILTLLLVLPSFSLFAGAQDSPLKFVALGDSIAWGAGVYNSEEACYARIVANTNGYDYVNHARNGSTSANLLQKLKDEKVIDDIKDADIINISIGGNDFIMQNVPLLVIKAVVGDYKIVDDIAQTLKENFAEIIAQIKSINPDAVIICQSLYNPRVDLLRGVYGLAVDRVNDCVYGYVEENPGAVELLDIRPIFENRFDYVAADTIHPSASGNVAIAGLMLEKLCELGLGENTEPVIVTAGRDEIPFSSEILGFIRLVIIKIISIFSFNSVG